MFRTCHHHPATPPGSGRSCSSPNFVPLDGMAKMKESDPSCRREFGPRRHASTDKRQQLTSHTKAREILEKDSRPERAEFLVEFAEWCLSVSLPRSVVDNALEGALDVLLDLDESHFAAALDAQAMAADNATLAKDGTASRGQSARSDARSSRGGDGRASASAGGARSVRSSGGARSVRSAGSTRSQGGRSSIGGSRGGRRASPVDVMAASLDAGQLDVIVRCLSMMASLAQTSRKRRDRALQAAYYCERCVSLAIRAANVAKAASVLETSDLVDDAACAAFSSALGLDLKEPISTANFCKVVLCVLEAARGWHRPSPPPAASDAVVAPFPHTAETLRSAVLYCSQVISEWSRWTPAPELISALQRLPSDLTAYAPRRRLSSRCRSLFPPRRARESSLQRRLPASGSCPDCACRTRRPSRRCATASTTCDAYCYAVGSAALQPGRTAGGRRRYATLPLSV